MKICAVIPAAGRGTRLGLAGPKILTPLTDTETIWSILHRKLSPLADHVQIVLSPDGAAAFPPLPANASITIQPEPIGMGDAIFRGYDVWSGYDAILVVWGDQVFVSADTLNRTIVAMTTPNREAVLPVTRMAAPYVEYVFDENLLTGVLQTREGDTTTSNGYSDVGTFLLGAKELYDAWNAYLRDGEHGAQTGEINFLPFLPFLAGQGWTITPVVVPDATEAHGINTKDDLAFFRSLYKE
ncbi:MAG TPA: NTP transferase domain-containing protein [Rhizomicrobium sp.]|jgi:bifunctional N-acetylglucosamine-1-phosphate-uridyltransferase/glucosamine-1-phosphate-acetyltransferase GlmU-like protein